MFNAVLPRDDNFYKLKSNPRLRSRTIKQKRLANRGKNPAVDSRLFFLFFLSPFPYLFFIFISSFLLPPTIFFFSLLAKFRACLHALNGQKTNAVASFVCFKRHLFGTGVQSRATQRNGKREMGWETESVGCEGGPPIHISTGLVGRGWVRLERPHLNATGKGGALLVFHLGRICVFIHPQSFKFSTLYFPTVVTPIQKDLH